MGWRDSFRKVAGIADIVTFGGASGFTGAFSAAAGAPPVAGPDTPPPLQVPEPPKAPDIDTAGQAAQDKMDAIRRRRGRTATIFTGEGGAPLPNTATAQLLGD